MEKKWNREKLENISIISMGVMEILAKM